MKQEEKLYRNREWMHHHRQELEESTSIMAQKAGCSHTTIGNWLYKLNISIPRKLYQDYDWMYHHHWGLMESPHVIARKAECDPATIRYWLHKLGISTRTVFEAVRNFLDMTPDLQEFIEGELLGDGCIVMMGQRSAIYQHGSKYEEYVIWLSEIFANGGLGQAGKVNKQKNGWGIIYHYHSKSYPELVSVRERWYPDGKKIVPQDLKLTPIMVRQWYIGDGYLCHQKYGKPHIELATCAFDKPSIDHLLKELLGLGFKVTHQLSHNTIRISTKSTQDFLDYIGPCPKEIEDIYGYKWDY